MLLALLLVSACSRSPASIEWQAPTMGTIYTIKAVAVPIGVSRESLRAEVEAILERIDRVFSIYRVDSEISRFNSTVSTEWHAVPAEMVPVVAMARTVSQISNGAFDITTSPLISLWGFGPKLGKERVPSPAAIAAVRGRVGYQKLQHRLQPPALRKQAGDIQIDVNALVAGYAADLVAERLEQAGIRNYMVDMGGELRLRGHNAKGKPWSIVIEKPHTDQGGIERVLTLTDCAISTSGDYKNFFEIDGQRFSHVLDARSGWPINHDLASVTVLAPTAMRADALATALLILGKERGYSLAEREQVAALFISRKGDGFEKRTTSAFNAYPMK